MRFLPAFLASGLMTAILAAPALATGNVNVVGGPRYLDDGSWNPVADQTALGITVDVGRKFWPINFAIGYHDSTATDHSVNPAPVGELDLKGRLQELDFGVLKSWVLPHRLRPFAGGGAGFVEGSSRATIPTLGSTHTSGTGAGAWMEGGVYWRLAGHLNLGIDARVLLGANVTMFGFSRSADYRQIGMLLGWGWPGAK
jgi:hypothetical protein